VSAGGWSDYGLVVVGRDLPGVVAFCGFGLAQVSGGPLPVVRPMRGLLAPSGLQRKTVDGSASQAATVPAKGEEESLALWETCLPEIETIRRKEAGWLLQLSALVCSPGESSESATSVHSLTTRSFAPRAGVPAGGDVHLLDDVRPDAD